LPAFSAENVRELVQPDRLLVCQEFDQISGVKVQSFHGAELSVRLTALPLSCRAAFTRQRQSGTPVAAHIAGPRPRDLQLACSPRFLDGAQIDESRPDEQLASRNNVRHITVRQPRLEPVVIAPATRPRYLRLGKRVSAPNR
jgi:hypothetical protein